MPRPEVIASSEPVTRSRLRRDLEALGVRRGGVVMVHASLRSLGWVVGGAQTVVEALLEAVGPNGTLCAQASWEDIPFGLAGWPERWRDAYRAELPPFDRRVSAAAPYEGRLAERIRTWPGAVRGPNPGAGVTAVGRLARWIAEPHRLDDGFGAGTPYSRLVDRRAQVLLLGAPLHTISLLHHAEAVARVPKAWVVFELPIAGAHGGAWRRVRELDVWRGPVPYARVLPGEPHPLGTIARAALHAGAGATGRAGQAPAHRFDAPALIDFAVNWLEARFPPAPRPAPRRSGAVR